MGHRSKWGIAALVGALACGALAAPRTAEAGTIVLAANTSSYSGANGGGEFGVASITGMAPPAMGTGVAVGSNVFQTFCLERDEYFSPGATYSWDLNTEALLGGANTNSGDPLDARTAYLYTQFYSGTLDDYTYTTGSGRTADATSLQLAIWYLEGEIGASALDAQAQSWVTAANDAVALGGDWYGRGIGNVRILNLSSVNSSGVRVHNQDMLVMVPLPPAALLGVVLMGGLVVFEFHRRRRRRALA